MDGTAYALLDAHRAIGMVAGIRAMRTAIAKARGSGIAIVVVRSSTHFGAAGRWQSFPSLGCFHYLGVADGERFAAERRSRPGVVLRLIPDSPRVWDLSGILPG